MTESGFIGFAPLFPWPVIAALAAVSVILVLAAGAGGGWAAGWRAAGWRALVLGVLILALANPRAIRQDRGRQSDIVLVVVDKSASQNAPGRRQQTRAALRRVLKAAAAFDGLEVKVVEYGAGKGGKGNGGGGTRLYSAMMEALAQVPEKRLAAAVLITDGQVRDVPPGLISPLPGGPVHVLLSGSDRDRDRAISVVKAPGFGIVGKKVSLIYRVEDGGGGAAGGGKIPVTLRIDGRVVESRPSRVGVEEKISFTIDHAGPVVAELTVPAVKGELSPLNNRVGLSINGVRDRLKVLLISGQPYMGERTWRNLLKSDPSVDLVHLTILRPPEKDDSTPINELALIAFPVKELFEKKLKKFDLIIFDRYMIRGVLPLPYMVNIAAYVRAGGALLFASGPEFAGIQSLYLTPLGRVMPVKPTGKVLEEAFYPRLTAKGRRHPVTASLAGSPAVSRAGGGKPAWGRWFRQVEALKTSGVTVMEGIDGRPLLVLDRVEKGRVAHLTSDQIWLWAKGFEGGGPYAELLRRLVHWLMKEPDLEENALTARIQDGELIIDRQSMDESDPTARVTGPAGGVSEVALKPAGPGRARGRALVTGPGIYRVQSGAMTALAAAGAAGSAGALEFADLRATAGPLKPLVRATGGGIAWIKDGLPDFRRTRPGGVQAGRGWMGLRRNGAYLIAGVSEIPLPPWYAYLIAVLGGLILAWRREGR